MPKLTKRLVEAVEPDDGRPIYLWDHQLSGFGLKVLPSGSRQYIVKYRTDSGGRRAQQRWMTLGKHGVLTCEQAREMAQQALAAVTRGEDPQAERLSARQAAQMHDLWERFTQEQLPLKKPSTAGEYQRQWEDIIAPLFGPRTVRSITRSDVEKLHKKMRLTPYRANRTLALLSRLMNLAEAWGLREPGTNPCRHVDKFKEEARERYLSLEEITRLGDALSGMVAEQEIQSEAAAAIRLLLLTGARLNEILTARWEWVDLERRVIHLPDSKTGKKPIFLSDAAAAVIEELRTNVGAGASRFMLPGRDPTKPLNNLAKPWRRVCDRAGLDGVRLHDLRHTAASIAVGRGVNLPIIGRLLGHRQAQTTMRYAHVDTDPALAAANSVGDAIGGALSGRRGQA